MVVIHFQMCKLKKTKNSPYEPKNDHLRMRLNFEGAQFMNVRVLFSFPAISLVRKHTFKKSPWSLYPTK